MTKEQQRAALHGAIWKIANGLRGSVDGWDFKQYVLGFLFYRFISENITDYLNKKVHAAGNGSFDYARLPDETAENVRQGFFGQEINITTYNLCRIVLCGTGRYPRSCRYKGTERPHCGNCETAGCFAQSNRRNSE